ncbi:hypothetical protein Rsub_03492 [Raphidocelis subcapitata]|uniref:Short-chain dehydrogenase n=1 Tax=Raphidocelis subcapitata TaxID=307507 RepID=A0A2V0NS89_9CHLO|nr:hypothetical protein Rsub_03492 [Raphidocelis subcapitata]|eukprot:GBF90496.1 hypothetical protein Rsub_03492 [Raphidocelis subcapitata]
MVPAHPPPAPALGAGDPPPAPAPPPPPPRRRVACVAGFGPAGISMAAARRFGGAGFELALLARRPERLAEGEERLRAAGITARGFAVDLADPSAVRAGLAAVARDLGPPEVLHWNPYNSLRPPLLQLPPEEVDSLMGVAVKGLLAAVQELLPVWEAWAAEDGERQPPPQQQQRQGQEQGQAPQQQQQQQQQPAPPRRRPALLVTGGGLALPSSARLAVEYGVEGISIAKAAQHQAVACLREALAPRGVFVGQVTVCATVRGTAWDGVRSSAEEEGDGGGGGAEEVGGGGGSKKQGAGGGGDGQQAEGEEKDEAAAGGPYVTPDEVADALWALCDEQPAGDAWHVMLQGRAV